MSYFVGIPERFLIAQLAFEMATNEKSTLDVEETLVTKKPPKGKVYNRKSVMCLYCYGYFGTEMYRHRCPSLGGRLFTSEEKVRCSDLVDSRNRGLAGHLFVNPDSDHFPSQDTFTRAEVLHLLQVLGHEVVPQEFRMADRHFGLPPWNPP